MSRVAELMIAVAGVVRGATDDTGRVFDDDAVRAELDRYDLSTLLKDSARAPFARICLLRAKPVRGADGRLAQDVSLAIIVVADREGAADPEFSSADIAALRLVDACTLALMLAPNVGLGRISDVDIGDGLVAVSEQSNDQGMAIAMLEAKWRLHDAYQPSPRKVWATALDPASSQPQTVVINGVEYPVGGQP
ncbi:hypothetical protein GCM10019059_34910 [Camelimonas fluminis]|uniref:Uncharacterized protein n=1 Tax=Camelimonas fluminis TaxID=1576911 RepID=A0ABV7UGE6_9HYPH|nr:hypothetical protein [Camelimonas fluminis]GHE72288.1 hypothetical protein GCM10019059_34910 [Camelimonas fluminis]